RPPYPQHRLQPQPMNLPASAGLSFSVPPASPLRSVGCVVLEGIVQFISRLHRDRPVWIDLQQGVHAVAVEFHHAVGIVTLVAVADGVWFEQDGRIINHYAVFENIGLGVADALGASVSYTHARYTTPITGLVDDGSGNLVSGTIRKAGEPFPGVAPWTIQLNGEYARPVGNAELYTRADFSYASHNKKPVDVNSPLVDPEYPRTPATSQLNLRLGARLDAMGSNDLDISLFVNNVTNEQPLLSLYHELIGSPRYRSGTFRPRTFGLTVSLRK
ncbi:TonB-dependent receptor, partial [Rhizorhapis sp. SPR117]|uniref:TonB-dependent receptor n=1 Tax=Rhizorhapis sp. SPR117 TaxID=2912611 RepID=UPI001F1B2640|nr:TonB-dependent receptor [Rhizorhapis sp. SPR117]